ncbi:DUF4105 domain-containing protein [Marinospirillum perlucidum]|uniref:Lnb N-terminal periplasmic domain-containing protein n=1 Tax=Marinospirillum perlucidum TaxID=1982602 RepID=UPI000DF4AA67|nr:DUF4105 domain-containing protein [Marinospirillum perlucidum]
MRSFPRFIFLLFLFVSSKSLAVTEESLAELSQTNGWLRLLHYSSSYGFSSSQIDQPDFFLSPAGNADPLEEMQATWQALQVALAAEPLLPEDEDVRCTYPARIAYLSRKLQLNLPARSCPELDEWMQQLDAGSLSMIFPAAYMNNASSMFGHTLLRIDAQDRERNPDLVAWAVNFAAEVDAEDGGAAYAIKGMLGFYPGYFNLIPYYEKVNEYSQLESRDMWEYPLQLNDRELQRVIWHLWELDHVRFDYWFFDENCSYQLLALLSVSRDDLHLTRGFDIKALPVDTLRALDEVGLLSDEGNYRPSFATRLENQSSQLNDQEVALARELVFAQVDPQQLDLEPGLNAAGIYEFAAEWLNFRFRHQGLSRDQAAPQIHRLLLARARLQARADFQPPSVPETPPHKGHATARWGLGGGQHEGENFLTLEARPSYHSRFDDLGGYLPNAEINLLDLQLRYYQEQGKLEPWRLTILEIGNYLPSSPVFDLAAWKVKTEVERVEPLASSRDAWRSRLEGGYGRAWGDGRDLMIFAFARAELEAGPAAAYLAEEIEEDWNLGVGAHSGLVWSPWSPLRLGLDVSATQLVAGNPGTRIEGEITGQWNLDSKHSLRLGLSGEQRDDETWEASLTWLRFF